MTNEEQKTPCLQPPADGTGEGRGSGKCCRLLVPGIFFAAATIVCVVALLLDPFLITRKLDRVRSDWDELARAFSQYYVDHAGFFPPDTSVRRKEDPDWPLTFEANPWFITHREVTPSHDRKETWVPLTTPMAYLTEFPRDPFHGGKWYGYTCWNWFDEVTPTYVLHSPGPDGMEDMPITTLRAQIGALLLKSPYMPQGGDPALYREIVKVVTPFLYDPTNGIRSRGDLIEVVDHRNGAFGWRRKTGLWSAYSLPPELADADDPLSRALERFKAGDLFPPPITREDVAGQSYFILLQGRSAAFVTAVSSVENGIARPRAALVAPARDRLGTQFGEFLDHPHVLNANERGELKRWREEEPDWWGAVGQALADGCDMETTVNLHIAGVYELVPLFGKSAVLLAAEYSALGDRESAEKTLGELRFLMAWLKSASRYQPNPFVCRVHDEMGLLCRKADATFATRQEDGK